MSINPNLKQSENKTIEERQMSRDPHEINASDEMKSEFKASPEEHQAKLMEQADEISALNKVEDDKETNETNQLIIDFFLIFSSQLNNINQGLINCTKEIAKLKKPLTEKVQTIENKNSANHNLSNESKIKKQTKKEEDTEEEAKEGQLFLNDSGDEMYPMIKGKIAMFNNKKIKFILQVKNTCFHFKKFITEPDQEDIGKYEVFFIRRDDLEGNVAFEVVLKARGVKLETYLKKQLAKIRQSFGARGGSNGDSLDYYLVMKFNNTQLQFFRKMNLRDDKYYLPYFFFQNDEDRFSIYCPSEEDRNRQVIIQYPTQKKWKKNKNMRRNDIASEQEIIEMVNEEFRKRDQDRYQPQMKIYKRKPRYKKQYYAPPQNNYFAHKHFNQYRHKNNNNRKFYPNNQYYQLIDEMDSFREEMKETIKSLRNQQSWYPNNWTGYNNRYPFYPFQY